MPTHRLTGNDLEALLARVPAEHGPEAVIVEANKLRTGGVAGFFAKETFEVVVEVPESAPALADDRRAPAPSTRQHARGMSIDELIAAASDGDGFDAGPASGTRPEAPQAHAPQRPLSAAPAPVAGQVEGSEPGPDAAGAPAVVGPAASTRTAHTPAAHAPTLSTDGAPFADVLGRLVRDLTAEGTPGPDAIDDDQAGPDAPFEPFQAVRVVGPRVAATPTVGTGPEAIPSHPLAHAPADPPEATAQAATAAPGLATIQVAPALPRPALEPAWLAQLGLPEEVAANLLPAGDPAIELLRMLERIPRPDALPTAPGCVIAVVGGREEAQEVAEAIAGSLRLDPDGIVVAAPRFGRSPLPPDRRITCAEHADDRRRAWRRRRTPTIVAVDAPISLDPGGTSWALHLVDALEPSQVWGVVGAARKTEDVAAWNELIGGIDALAVNQLHATSSPAAILGAGIPVGLIDGRDATAARWAAVLTERIAA